MREWLYTALPQVVACSSSPQCTYSTLFLAVQISIEITFLSKFSLKCLNKHIFGWSTLFMHIVFEPQCLWVQPRSGQVPTHTSLYQGHLHRTATTGIHSKISPEPFAKWYSKIYYCFGRQSLFHSMAPKVENNWHYHSLSIHKYF